MNYGIEYLIILKSVRTPPLKPRPLKLFRFICNYQMSFRPKSRSSKIYEASLCLILACLSRLEKC